MSGIGENILASSDTLPPAESFNRLDAELRIHRDRAQIVAVAARVAPEWIASPALTNAENRRELLRHIGVDVDAKSTAYLAARFHAMTETHP